MKNLLMDWNQAPEVLRLHRRAISIRFRAPRPTISLGGRWLRVEVDRLRSRRVLVEGRLKASLLKLKVLAGMAAGESLRLREDLDTPVLPSPPASIDAAIDIAMFTRPDLRLARLTEEVA